MQIRDWFILLFTFVIGLFCGVYLFTTNYLPNYVDDETEEKVQDAELLILGVQYGGVALDVEPPSFRVQAVGEYDYFPGGSTDNLKESGELPARLFNSLVNALGQADLEALAVAAEKERCAPVSDGIEYEYTVEYLGVEYTLDTCTTDFSNETDLGQAFLPLWDYMDDPDTFSFSLSNSPGGLDTSDAEAAEEYGSTWTLRGYFERGFRKSGFEGE